MKQEGRGLYRGTIAGESVWFEALGAAITALREQARMSQAELADRTGIPRSEVVEIEAGRLEATWGDLRRLACALGLPLPDLIREGEARESS